MATAVVFGKKSNKMENVTVPTPLTTSATSAAVTQAKIQSKQQLPSGVITKPNTTGYDIIKPGNISQGYNKFFYYFMSEFSYY